ncbi:MAG: hypothetical protein LBV40_00010 [Methanomicrobiales archaeon]|nr:hypothetical protein [Methanomicrobiales archaeon]
MMKPFSIVLTLVILLVLTSPLTASADVVVGYGPVNELPTLMGIIVLVAVLIVGTAVLIRLLWKPKKMKMEERK